MVRRYPGRRRLAARRSRLAAQAGGTSVEEPRTAWTRSLHASNPLTSERALVCYTEDMSSTEPQRWARVPPGLAWKRPGLPREWVRVLQRHPEGLTTIPGWCWLETPMKVLAVSEYLLEFREGAAWANISNLHLECWSRGRNLRINHSASGALNSPGVCLVRHRPASLSCESRRSNSRRDSTLNPVPRERRAMLVPHLPGYLIQHPQPTTEELGPTISTRTITGPRAGREDPGRGVLRQSGLHERAGPGPGVRREEARPGPAVSHHTAIPGPGA
jgi:hypothetical protein